MHSRHDFVDFLKQKLSISGYEQNNLFLSLKAYESDVIGKGSVDFDISQIGKILDQFEVNTEVNSQRVNWSGFISHTEYRSILNFALIQSNGVITLSQREDWRKWLEYCEKNQRSCLILSEWGFPFGGAEAFFNETAYLLFELGFLVKWGNFQVPGRGYHEKYESVNHRTYTEFRFNRIPNEVTLSEIVLEESPDIIFSHGKFNDVLAKITAINGMVLIEGFHFWTGLIDLYQESNTDILSNIPLHNLVKTNSIERSPGSQKYLVSQFMLDVYEALGGTDEFRVIDPTVFTNHGIKFANSYGTNISQLDVSIGKGGYLFCQLVEQLGSEIPFTAVIRETTETAIKERLLFLSQKFPLLTLIPYSEITSILRDSRLILIPSLVDETYNRVAEEGIQFGIPVLTSDKGNLRYLLEGEGSINTFDSSVWINTIKSLYFSEENSRKLWTRQSRVLLAKKNNSSTILEIILDAIKSFRVENVGVFTVNAPQGLGTLGKILIQQMDGTNLNSYIFSFSPYSKELETKNYWSKLDSPNFKGFISSKFTRENVPIAELLNFIDEFKIDVFIFPEVCWIDNWTRLFKIKSERPYVRLVTMPMLETVIRDEVKNMNEFSLTLFPTEQSQTVLEKYDVKNGVLLGFTSPVEIAFDAESYSALRIEAQKPIRFLHVGGHNPTVRKQTPLVINEFIEALRYRSDITLTVTLQKITPEIAQLRVPKEITIVSKPLSDSDIADLYLTHDVSIQIPSHEGIGIGFFESISLGCPVVTIDSPPHNEVVKSTLSGWLLEASEIQLPDNPVGIVSAAVPTPGSLAKFLKELTREDILITSSRTREYYLENFSNEKFRTNFLQILHSKRISRRTFAKYKANRFEISYQRFFEIAVIYFKRYVFSKLPLSAKVKYRVKATVLVVDRMIRKLLS
jgi:glycosyltransferase involved in cell wall biosynthesis